MSKIKLKNQQNTDTQASTKNKRKMWIPAAIGLLIVGFVSFGWSLLTNPTSAFQVHPSFTLYKESGKVSFKLPGSDTYQEIAGNSQNLADSTYIKTEQGLAHILFPNNSMLSLDQDTELQIHLDQNSTLIQQLAGNTWNRVQKLASQASYKVETPTALATVRGTKFAVEIPTDPNKLADIYVIESKVDVGQITQENGQTVVKNEQLITPGKLARIPDYQIKPDIKTFDLQSDKQQDPWFTRNSEIDKIYDQQSTPKKDLIDVIKQRTDLPTPTSNELLSPTPTTDSSSTVNPACDLNSTLRRIDASSPSLTISEPTKSKTLTEGDSLNVQASLTSTCDVVDQSHINWTLSNSDHSFTGTGEQTQFASLPSGTFTLTARYSDNTTLGDTRTITVNPKPVETPKIETPSPTQNPVTPSPREDNNSPTVTKPDPNHVDNTPVTPPNQAPSVQIISPADGTLISGTQFLGRGNYIANLNATGSGNDPEDGQLPDTNLSWYIDGDLIGTGATVSWNTNLTDCAVQTRILKLIGHDSLGLESSVQISLNFQQDQCNQSTPPSETPIPPSSDTTPSALNSNDTNQTVSPLLMINTAAYLVWNTQREGVFPTV